MNKTVAVAVNGKTVYVEAGMTLSEIIKGEKPCGGHGRCGKCRVKVSGAVSEPTEGEKSLLSPEELAEGVRLACLTRVIGDCRVTAVSHSGEMQIVTDGILPHFRLAPGFRHYGVAVDIGTTTVAARLYDVKGSLLAHTAASNPQGQWGADVISRVEAALGGMAKELSLSVRAALVSIIEELCSAAGIGAEEIDGAVITGNTVMLTLLTEESAEPFSRAPFDVKRLFGETLRAEELSLSCLRGETPVYIPPCISAFVGADITSAVLATGLCENSTAMLADIGTNGEVALWHNGALTVCSTAAGPAFEGVGISSGMRGAVGAVDRVTVSDGRITAHVIGDAAPLGICGSGLIDSAACMLELGIIDENGYLESGEQTIVPPVSLTQNDIRMLQLAKGAVCAGIMTLTDRKKITAADIPSFYLAGGFGSYLSVENAAKIGLFPRALSDSVITVGNAALSGASLLLLDSGRRKTAHELASSAVTLELSTDPVFFENYVKAMLLKKM